MKRTLAVSLVCLPLATWVGAQETQQELTKVEKGWVKVQSHGTVAVVTGAGDSDRFAARDSLRLAPCSVAAQLLSWPERPHQPAGE